MDEPTLPLRSARGDAFEIIVCEGESVTRVPLVDVCTIGRGDEATINIASRAASRVHARVRRGPPITVEDLGSVNPTTVDGRKLAAGEVVEIGEHAVITVAEAQLVLRRCRSLEAAPVSSVPAQSMARVWQLVELAAPSELSILVLGETGVGKEVVAKAIHARSGRAGHAMLAINCAALNESTLESELFGHEKGAFTGAISMKLGLLEAANGSTVLLDEIGEMPAALQAKLLRALDAREIVRLGAVKPRAIDVRVIAATHRDLATMVDEGSFRADLLFRLDGLTIHVPPLRARKDEILPLARDFAKRPLGADVERVLVDHDWPGNVRELKKVIERALVLARGQAIRVEHLQLKRPSASVAPPAGGTDFRGERERAERRSIEQALDQCGGNQTRAAEVLGISRRTLVERIGRYGIKRGAKG